MYVVIYLPYVFGGGFITDDWGVVHRTYDHKGFWNTYLSWFPLFSNRPLAPLLLSLTGNIFGQWTVGYILVNLFFWFTAIFIIALTFKKYFNIVFSFLFIAFAGVPVFSSTVIFSTIMQITGTTSIFLWALSFYFLDKYLRTKKNFYYLSTYVLLVIAMLIYEIILPLLLITILFPVYVELTKDRRRSSKKILNYLVKYSIPVILILIGIFIYQKVIMPRYMIVYSRFNPLLREDYWLTALKIILSWFWSLFILFPILLISSVFYFGASIFNRLDLILILILVVSFFLLIFNLKIRKEKVFKKNRVFLFGIILLSFLGSVSLYVLSNSSPNISGYDNRGLTSTWIILSMILAFMGYILHGRKVSFLIYILLILSIFSFIAQRDNYIQSYKIQNEIANDAVVKIKDIHIPSEIVIIGNVPEHPIKNFNNEEVFDTPWDFGAILHLRTQGKVADGNTVPPRKVKENKIDIKDDYILTDGLWKASIHNLWFYEYDQSRKKSFIIKVKDAEHLRNIINEIANKNINNSQVFYRQLIKEVKYFLIVFKM